MKSIYISVCICILGLQIARSQKTESTPTTLEEKFQTMLDKSWDYRNKDDGMRHEDIRLDRLIGFRNEVFDSLSTLKSEKATLLIRLEEKENALKNAEARYNTMKEELAQLEATKEQIQFLGIPMSKTGYRALNGSIIFCLLGGLVFFIYKFRHSNYVTQQARSAIAEMEHEFEQHRRWALEREQKLSRELLDERNKKRQTT